MKSSLKDTGLYWRPLGGNNIDQISGHCYQYTCVWTRGGQNKYSSLLVDLGKFDNHQALGIQNSIAAVPDIREVLQDKELNLKALLLTHSHPDHLNGIIHYIRAGYKLPPLYGGRYTKMVLEDLYLRYQIGRTKQPDFVVVKTATSLNADGWRLRLSARRTPVLTVSVISSATAKQPFITAAI